MNIITIVFFILNAFVYSGCRESDAEHKKKMEKRIAEKRKELKSENKLFEPELIHEIQLSYPTVLKASFSKSGDKVAAMTLLGGPEVFDVQRGEKLDILPKDDGIFEVAFHPSDSIIGVLYSSGDAQLWDFKNQTELGFWKNEGEFSTHQNGSCLDFTKDGKYFAFPMKGETAVKVVDIASEAEIVSVDVAFVNSISIHPDGSHLAISMEKGFKIFSVADGKELLFKDKDESHSNLMWHPNGDMISVTGVTGGPTRTWKFSSGERLNDLENFGTPANYNPIAITSSVDLIWGVDTYSSKNKVYAYNADSRKLQFLLEHKKSYPSCLFSPIGTRKIYVISESGYLMVWAF